MFPVANTDSAQTPPVQRRVYKQSMNVTVTSTTTTRTEVAGDVQCSPATVERVETPSPSVPTMQQTPVNFRHVILNLVLRLTSL